MSGDATTGDPTRDAQDSRRLGELLTPAIDEARIAAAWQRIGAAKRAPARTRRGLVIGFGVAGLAAAAAALLVVVLSSRSVGPLAVATGTGGAGASAPAAVSAGALLDAPATAARTVTLDDGSTIELAAGAQLEVLDNDADRFVTLLHHGRTHFDVRPGGPRRWEIESSRATVEVVGTAFVVSADDRQLVVSVERGVVVVRGERVPGRVVRLTAGQQLVVDDSQLADAARPAQAQAQPAVAAPVVAAPAVAAPAVAAPAVAAKPLEARSGSGSGSKTDAPVHAIVTPSHPAATPALSLSAALALADTQRGHGDAAAAADTIVRALAAAPRDESAGLAYFTLGRIYLDDLSQPSRAASAFEHVIALGSPHSLLEDAYARRAIALRASGRSDDAARALAAYDAAYPHGVRRSELHQLFGAP
jgi:transmembrane sensor|nr:FecR family protein [Kofleriaceae bacterium]